MSDDDALRASAVTADALLRYHLISAEIGQHEVHVARLRHEQALLIGLMHKTLSYRVIAPMLGISKSRVEQLANSTALRKEPR